MINKEKRRKNKMDKLMTNDIVYEIVKYMNMLDMYKVKRTCKRINEKVEKCEKYKKSRYVYKNYEKINLEVSVVVPQVIKDKFKLQLHNKLFNNIKRLIKPLKFFVKKYQRLRLYHYIKSLNIHEKMLTSSLITREYFDITEYLVFLIKYNVNEYYFNILTCIVYNNKNALDLFCKQPIFKQLTMEQLYEATSLMIVFDRIEMIKIWYKKEKNLPNFGLIATNFTGYNNPSIIEYFIKQKNEDFDAYMAFISACIHGDIISTKLIYENWDIDIRLHNDIAFHTAYELNHTNILFYLSEKCSAYKVQLVEKIPKDNFTYKKFHKIYLCYRID